MTVLRWTVTTEAEVTPEALARLFCEMDDDAQAQFFVHVARLMAEWDRPGAADDQIWYIATHLHECECSTPAAREWIRDLAQHLATKAGRP